MKIYHSEGLLLTMQAAKNEEEAWKIYVGYASVEPGIPNIQALDHIEFQDRQILIVDRGINKRDNSFILKA